MKTKTGLILFLFLTFTVFTGALEITPRASIDTREVASILVLEGNEGETIPLTIRGNLYVEEGGTFIEGQDYALIIAQEKSGK